jgi:TonB-dependent starch-binding outer membrane protein SusC
MNNIKYYLIFFTFLTFNMLSHAQSIKGKVTDTDGLAFVGANVVNESNNANASTDFDGSFTIKAKVGDNLRFSMLGFNTIVRSCSDNMIVTLSSETKALLDIVVIGYGTRKKADNTTSITSLSAEDITKTKVLNATQAIQGKAAGVQVIASDTPGSTPSIVIRGLGTALGGRIPLFVVDGMPTDNINNINSNDITSYEILKDASALAIYGNRAANGVIIITTKKGKGEKPSLEFESFIGFRTPLSVVKVAGSNQYSYYSNAALGTTTFSQDQPVNTDWFKEITRTGNYTQNNMSISGASDNIKYFFSLGYYDEKAILDGLDYSRLTFRNNNEFNISKKIKITQNFSVGYTHSTPKPLSAFTAAYKQSPIVPVRFSTGQYGVSFVGANGFASTTGSSFNNVGNPVAQLDLFNEQQKSVLLQGGLKLDYEILKSLKFTSQFSGEFYNWKQYNFEDSKAIWLAADPTRTESAYPALNNLNLLSKAREDYFNWNLVNYLTYNKVFGAIHDIELTAGVEAFSKGSRENIRVTRKNANANENYWALTGVDYSASVLGLGNTVSNESRLSSYFGRFQYKLMNKYLLTGTLRRDGSSQFGKEFRFGTFPSFGLGWVISKEAFMANVKGVDVVKLRGGWGKLGNQNVPLNVQSFATGLDTSLGGAILVPGTTINSQIDPSLSWEITQESSVGLDFEILDKKLKGTLDLYDKKTTNLILNTVPFITSGVSNGSPAHVGEVSNKGYEISLRWDDKISDTFNYWIGGNFSTNKNELTSLKDVNLAPVLGGGLGNGQYTKLLDNSSVGQPLGSFYLYEFAGIENATGNLLYFKNDGSTTIQSGLVDADRKYSGSVLPDATYGISFGVNFKNFDFSADSYGTLGSKVYNGKKAQRFSGENIEAELASDFWTANNMTASNPAPFNQVPVASTYYLESGDFLRVNNITLGYKIPVNNTPLTSARIYFNAINPFITKKFSGFSPELNGNGNPYESQGIELDAYPTLRSLVFGLNLKF